MKNKLLFWVKLTYNYLNICSYINAIFWVGAMFTEWKWIFPFQWIIDIPYYSAETRFNIFMCFILTYLIFVFAYHNNKNE